MVFYRQERETDNQRNVEYTKAPFPYGEHEEPNKAAIYLF